MKKISIITIAFAMTFLVACETTVAETTVAETTIEETTEAETKEIVKQEKIEQKEINSEDINASIQEKLTKIDSAYKMFSTNWSGDVLADNVRKLMVDNIEHWTDYYFDDEPNPTFKDGTTGYDNTNIMYAAICNGYDEIINQGKGQQTDHITWLNTFDNEQAVLDKWCNGKTENIKDVSEMYMLGVVRYGVTLLKKGYALGDIITDNGTYQWNGHVSTYIVPITISGRDSADFKAIFDKDMNLMNIIYIGEGSDLDVMHQTRGSDDFLTRKEKGLILEPAP